ncbi:hypothetical protein DICSQDRAFT_156897, partial [Dichomitus squalens LYAD-421 SS1]
MALLPRCTPARSSSTSRWLTQATTLRHVKRGAGDGAMKTRIHVQGREPCRVDAPYSAHPPASPPLRLRHGTTRLRQQTSHILNSVVEKRPPCPRCFSASLLCRPLNRPACACYPPPRSPTCF